MDPLSISASVLTVIQGGHGAYKGICRLMSLKQANPLISQIQDDIADLQLIIQEAQAIFPSLLETSRTNQPTVLGNAINSAKRTVLDLEQFIEYKLLTTTSEGGSRISKRTWLQCKDEIASFRARLRDAIASIQLGILLYAVQQQQAQTRYIQNAVNELLHRQEEQSQNNTIADANETGVQLHGSRRLHQQDTTTGNSVVTSSSKPASHAAYRRAVCDSSCRCSCHWRGRWQSPRWAKAWSGSFSIGYSTPVSAKAVCQCPRPDRYAFTASYSCPTWLLYKAVCAKLVGGTAPEFLLRVYNIRPFDSRILQAIKFGDYRECQRLLAIGEASIFDVDETGDVLVSYALGGSKCTPTLVETLCHGASDNLVMQSNNVSVCAYFSYWDRALLRPKAATVSPFEQQTFGTKLDTDLMGFTEVHCAVLDLLPPDHVLATNLTNVSRDALDLEDDTGRTPLMWACARGSKDNVASLLRIGAKPNAIDRRGWTALHYWAEYSCNEDILDLLLTAGCDVNAAEYITGASPLHLMIAFGRSSEECLKKVVEAGASLHCTDSLQWTLLHTAAFYGNSTALRWLLGQPYIKKKELDLNAQDSEGRTALLLALEWCRYHCFALLLAAGADCTQKDHRNRDVYSLAPIWADIGSLQLLLSRCDRDIREASAADYLKMLRRAYKRANGKLRYSYGQEPPTEDRHEWFKAFTEFFRKIGGQCSVVLEHYAVKKKKLYLRGRRLREIDVVRGEDRDGQAVLDVASHSSLGSREGRDTGSDKGKLNMPGAWVDQ